MRLDIILLFSYGHSYSKAFTITNTRLSLVYHSCDQRLFNQRDDEPYDNNNDNERIKPPIPSSSPSCNIVIREATEEDIPTMARILTDGFHSETTNILTYPLMRLDTFINHKFRFGDRIGPRYGTFVACHLTTADADGGDGDGSSSSSRVVGCCEVDDAPTMGEKNPAPRPYMCNLAVDVEFQRNGVAGALVRNCERVVRDEYERSLLHLRMREGNQAAFDLYTGLGYKVESKYVNEKEETVLLMAKTLDQVE